MILNIVVIVIHVMPVIVIHVMPVIVIHVISHGSYPSKKGAA